MLVFVTVGSTKFDALIRAVLSADVLQCLQAKGYTSLVVQCGNSRTGEPVPNEGKTKMSREGVDIELWKFKPSLVEEYEKADLIISHAGSGTILDVLRRDKPLIVVPNPTLLDNHQQELAQALSEQSYLLQSSVDPSELSQSIRDLDPSELRKFPAMDGSRFRQILDEEMGFL
ncbi:glycosyltransferase family 1 protein [Pleurotus eryngii]|uniref:UDP-N-acetylglucosamine transferase subunit ALG13 n=1 Tax=Pleurotus eryngii TaxID=5323 RepID=A0A9P6ABE9_PLEER|nr:glycosyltransferase family 1 protein [Pleurotus eryngii]